MSYPPISYIIQIAQAFIVPVGVFCRVVKQLIIDVTLVGETDSLICAQQVWKVVIYTVRVADTSLEALVRDVFILAVVVQKRQNSNY
jgi:hypothetical protein